MNKDDILTLFDYNYWANDRVINAASKVSVEQFMGPVRLSHKSIRGTLVHILGAEMVWRLRCQEGVSPSALPTETELQTLEAIRARWAEEEHLMRAYLASLDNEALYATVQYKTTKGVPYEGVVWRLLFHVVNHGTQFRSEAAVALTAYGQSPGDLDLLFFFREGGTLRT